jgi:hypothetical protein
MSYCKLSFSDSFYLNKRSIYAYRSKYVHYKSAHFLSSKQSSGFKLSVKVVISDMFYRNICNHL